MGTENTNFGRQMGALASFIFIAAAFVILLVKESDLNDGDLTFASQMVLTAAGIAALIAGLLLMVRKIKVSLKWDGVLIFLLGCFSALTYVLLEYAGMDSVLVIEIIGIVGAAAMAVSSLTDKVKNHMVMMCVDLVGLLIEAVIVITLYMGGSLVVKEASVVIVFGLWLSIYSAMSTDDVAVAEAGIDPERKSAKKAQKQKSKADAKAKKEMERQEKLDARSRAEAKAKHKKEKAEKREEAKADHKGSEAKKEESEKKAEPAPAKEVPKEQNNDFMSRLVSSKDAGGKVAHHVKEEPEEAAPVVAEKPAEPVKAEPVKEEPKAEPAPIPVPVEEPKAEETAPVYEAEPEDDEVLMDIYTDYSPEALVRRAAWNKGMRCRRDYGEYHIPVAFVKGKVAVYVEEPGNEDREIEGKLKEEGWIVLRYDINEITDGLAEGAEIADTVKANMRALKAAKKRASKK